jgi:putative membrane protein
MGMRYSLALILISALALPACKKNNTETPPATAAGSGSAPAPAPAAAPAPPPPPARAPGALSDPQIAAIVVAANQVDIDAGNLAIKKTKNAEVKKFAEQMVTDHTSINKAAVDLVTKLKVTPEESDASKGLTSGGADNRAKLEKLDGAAFDKAYVDNEVAYHKAVIDVIDTKLIPSATNADLKSTLVSVKPAIEEHLKHAEMVQAKLGGGSGAAPHKM